MYAVFNSIEIRIKITDAEYCSQCGMDATPMVSECISEPYYADQLSKLDPAKVASELGEYGAWDDEELKDHAENLARLFWIACGNVSEQFTELDIHSIWDNGGETLDRYTVVFNDRSYLSLSENGLGISLWGELTQDAGDYLGEQIEFDDLSDDLQDHIYSRVTNN